MVQTFLLSGTPLRHLEYFRPLLLRHGLNVPDASDLSATYIPRVEEREMSTLREELKGAFVGIAFDGTSRLGEAVNITGRFCTSDFVVETRLLRFITTKLHLKAPQFCSLITRVICSELAMNPDKLVAMSRDSALVNGAACRLLSQASFSSAEVILCISHTLNNVGSRIEFDTLQRFMTPWLELVGGRNPHRGAQALWRTKVHPQKVPGYSAVRWYASAEIQFVLAANFDKLVPFLQELDELQYGDATRKKLHDILDDPAERDRLRLQLAAMLDMRVLVQTTYELEGDRLEILLMHSRVERLRMLGDSIRSGGDGVLRNVDAVLRASVTLKNGIKVSKVPHRSLQPHGHRASIDQPRPLLDRRCFRTLVHAKARSLQRARWTLTSTLARSARRTKWSTRWMGRIKSLKRRRYGPSSSSIACLNARWSLMV